MNTDNNHAHPALESGQAGAGQMARKYGPLAIIVALLAFAWQFGWFEQLSLSNMIMQREWLAGWVGNHYLAAILLYCVLYAVLVAISFPGASVVTILAGFLFGGAVAGLATVFSATVGATAIFLVARSSFGDFLEKRASGFVGRMAAGFRADAFSYLLSLRLTPLFPFWVINIVPALLNMRVWPYAVSTFIGIIPGTFAYAYIGAGLESVIAAQEAANPGCMAAGTCSLDVKSLVTPQMVAAMAGLGVVSLAPVVLKRLGWWPAPKA
jgi:uncharacterized membrane protein YdjX (TVP38/TMEM64 family)